MWLAAHPLDASFSVHSVPIRKNARKGIEMLNCSSPSLTSSSLSSHSQPIKTLARVSENWWRRCYTPLSPAFCLAGSSRRASIPPIQTAVGPEVPIADLSRVSTASEVVREFYDGINRRDLASVEGLIAEGCLYEDLVFSRPFVGRKAILEFFKNFTESISADLQFVIDDMSSEDTSAVGVTWHLDWQGRPFPFSKGCSFYRLELLNGRRQIVYARDCVEPAAKPGEAALVLTFSNYSRTSIPESSTHITPIES